MPSLLVTLALLPAAAFAPHDDHWMGIEPHRIYHTSPGRQSELLQSPAFLAFQEAYPGRWFARFDEVTGHPIRLWGEGVPLGPVQQADSVDRAVRYVLDRHADLFGHEAGTLVTRSVNWDPRLAIWYLDYDQWIEGAPVYRAGLTARVSGGRLVQVGGETYATTRREGSFGLSAVEAQQLAVQQGPAPHAAHTELQAERRWLVQEDVQGLRLVATWMVQSRTQDPPGIWVTFIDAESGEVRSVHNEVRYFTGEATGRHEPRTLDGSPPVDFPLPRLGVTNGVETTFTSDSGSFDLPDAPTYSAAFLGSYLSVDNTAGPNALVDGPGDLLFTSANADPAEIATWIFLHQIRAWGEANAPEVGMSSDPLDCFVNLSQTCNAFYDGNVNFFSAGGGCNNTGRIADVNYHEWGHGFHYYSLRSGFYDGSLGEGAADVVAFLQTDDNVIAPFFGTSGWGIRDVEPNQAYPEDYVNSDYYVHSNGLIFGGALWDLWQILRDDLGEGPGTQVTTDIFTGLLKGGPGVAESFDEAMVADDDNSNLGDGTPHLCALIDAFGPHGLGPAGTSTLFLDGHEPLVSAPAGRPIEVLLRPQSAAPECLESDFARGELSYRVNGGEWQEQAFDVGGGEFSTQIPEQPLGAFVEYWVELQDSSGNSYLSPSGGYIHPYSFYVGDVLELGCDDFEADDGGYNHRLVDGEDVEGADDWMWGKPTGLSGDPSFAHSGEFVWGNDLGGGNYNGAYQDDKHNRLISREYEYSEHFAGVFLHYYRWLGVEDAFYDQAIIRADGAQVWRNWGTVESVGDEHHLDNRWMPHAVPLDGQGDDGAVQFSWDIVSDGGLAFGGWNLDDVCVLAPATADNRLGITDFDADSVEGGVEMTWTHPRYRPVTKVRVVRSNTWPTGADDGVIIAEFEDPEPGEEGEAFDNTAYGGKGYYAVYGFDGTEWLSWTVEGWNAEGANGPGGPALEDGGDLDAPGEDGELSVSGGCACQSSGGAPLGWLAPAWLLAFLRRRR